ncbi:MAG: Hsp20/alpha crystallin family protein [bacterium]|nr:Hsp20/alpha crystallin family protein [Patescibacteria group bacterium]MDW8279970.1 Hsp20/alpha crystallin family protein [bacterium]
MSEEQDKDFFEKLANYSEEFKNNNQDYEIKFAKSTSSNLKQKEENIFSYEEKEDDFEDGDVEGQLAIDVYQTDEDIVIESAIAGVDPEDLDINVTNDSITIKGKRKPLNDKEEKNYLYQECFWGKFSRSIILPQEIDPDRATVHFKNGVLKVRLPKLNRKKVKKLKVKIE